MTYLFTDVVLKICFMFIISQITGSVNRNNLKKLTDNLTVALLSSLQLLEGKLTL